MQSPTQKPARDASPVGAPGGTAVGPFVRPASGLVREITAWQVFGFNVMNANIGIGLVWLLERIARLHSIRQAALDMGMSYAKAHGMTPRARVVAMATAGNELIMITK